MSPTERTLALLRSQGYSVGKVERWIPEIKKRIDLFGCIDLIAIKSRAGQGFNNDGEQVSGPTDCGIFGIQATSGSNHAAHRTKALCEPLLGVWLSAGGRFQIITWSRRGAAGKRKVWTERVEELTLDDFHDPIATAQRADAVKERGRLAEVKREERSRRRCAKTKPKTTGAEHEYND